MSVSFLAAVALALGACGPSAEAETGDNVRRCVDKDNRIVEDKICEDIDAGHSHVYSTPYFWYFGGLGRGLGYPVSGGSYQPRSGVNYVPATAGSGSRTPGSGTLSPDTAPTRGGIGTTGGGSSGVSGVS